MDLATIAGQLDEEERRRMAGGTAGENSEEYRRFIAQPSANMDDTGYILDKYEAIYLNVKEKIVFLTF